MTSKTLPPVTVLIVDDEEGIRNLYSRWMKDLGYESEVAEDAQTAKRLMNQRRFDVVVCDIRMPGWDGIWLIDRLATEHPDATIIVATGVAEMPPAVTLRPNVEAYLVKPFDRHAMKATISQVLKTRADRQLSRPSDTV